MKSSIKARNSAIVLEKIEPDDEALELMYFGSRGMTRRADEYLATIGLSRVHHRILYSVARGNGPTVSDLIAILSISKQALHRPLKQLLEMEFVSMARDPARHRFKILSLTPGGRKVETRASELERQVMRRAFAKVGSEGKRAWLAVMAEAARDL
jgi:DNA-binding MarR family transcriptional regulator